MLNKENIKKRSIITIILVICFILIGFGTYKYNKMQEYNKLANNSTKSGNYDDANKYIDEVLKIDSNNADAKKLKDDAAKSKQEDQKKVNVQQDETDNNNTNSSAVTQEQAINIVANLINNKGPKTVVQCENTESKNGSNYYLIHVFDNMSDHTATRGWYYVEVNTGKAYEWDLVVNQLIPIN